MSSSDIEEPYDERERRYEDQEDEEGEEVGYHHDEDEDDEEEEEEEDEEEAKKVAEGFIVDDEDEDQESDESTHAPTRKKRRRRIEEELNEDLDEEDLELLEENTGLKMTHSPKMKRLKRGRAEAGERKQDKGSMDIFSDEEAAPVGEEEEEEEERGHRKAGRGRFGHRDYYDDMGDFIADEDEDDLEQTLDRRYGREDRAHGEGDDRLARSRKDLLEMLPEGINEDVLDDMYDIFGNGEDYAWAYPDEEEEMEKRQQAPKLADIFEPGDLAERMMTEEDEEIRLRDIPERLQMRYEGRHRSFEEMSDKDVEEAGTWVANTLVKTRNMIPTEKFVEAVTRVVDFMSRSFFEVPYIKDQRQDFFTEMDPNTGLKTDILTESDLWEIYDLEFKFNSFKERQKVLRSYLEKYRIKDDYVEEMVSKISRIEEVNDIMDYVNIHFVENISAVNQHSKTTKRPISRSLYHLSRSTQIPTFLEHFGIRARDFGENYLEGNRRYYPNDSMVDPEEDAALYTDSTYSEAEKVLMAAKRIIAEEIAHDPRVRKAVRQDWEQWAVIHVRPTEKGLRDIDEFHPLHPYKFLCNKPISSFLGGTFLQILKGKSDGLVTMEITLEHYEGWFEKLAEYYISDGYSDSVQRWNHQRKEALQEALQRYLIPHMTRHITEKLQMEGQERICKDACQHLYNKINVGPFRGIDADRYKNNTPRVVTLSNGNGDRDDPIVAVFLNHRGERLDHIQVPNLKMGRYQKDLVDFIRARKPNVVGVAGYNAQAIRLLKLVQPMVKEVNDTRESGAATVDLIVVDDEASRLYKNSKRALSEFGEYSEAIRYCISLARRLQSPVMEYAGLGSDLLEIQHHPLQKLVAQDQLLYYLERALIMVINDLGVDINAATRSPYLANTLQYVSGFGPRKAQSILKKLEATGELESRSALVMRNMTPTNFFINCATYLRIRNIKGADILDDTRIHPRDYELARKMAVDALEVDEDNMDDYDSKIAIVQRVVHEYPDKLNDLILGDYARVLLEQYKEPKRQILEHIKQELQDPYHDRRRRYVRPSFEEAFYLLTGETMETLSPGIKVLATVTGLRGKVAYCELSSGVESTIFVDNVADQRVMSVGDVLRVGQAVTCKVLHVDYEHFVVDLTCKPADVNDTGSDGSARRPHDAYFDYETEKREMGRLASETRRKQRSRRGCEVRHPDFRPFNHREAEEYLATRNCGDLVIRPSSKGENHVAVTWKMDDGVYQHLDVVQYQDHGMAMLKLSDNTAFSDWDELIVNYIDAMSMKVDELKRHSKYREGGYEALDKFLQDTTRANPRASAYGFCMSEKPGYFCIGFRLRSNLPMQRWYIKPLPKGYVMNGTPYPSVEALIDGFKQRQLARARAKRPSQPHH